jgi:hypothetical protein
VEPISGTKPDFILDLRFMTNTTEASTATTTSTPITMPAIAPALVSFLFLEEENVLEEYDLGIDETELLDVDDITNEALSTDVAAVDEERAAAEVDVEDNGPPSICASLMTLGPLLQQSYSTRNTTARCLLYQCKE